MIDFYWGVRADKKDTIYFSDDTYLHADLNRNLSFSVVLFLVIEVCLRKIFSSKKLHNSYVNVT